MTEVAYRSEHHWTRASSAWAGTNGGRLYCVDCSQRQPRETWGTPAQIVWAEECPMCGEVVAE